METLSKKEQEYVAIGAALGSNCIPCIVYHIGESKKIGISGNQIREAISIAEKVKKVPAEKVLSTAYAQLENTDGNSAAKNDCITSCCE
jgi:AhpD family alkylhydroperoxidase